MGIRIEEELQVSREAVRAKGKKTSLSEDNGGTREIGQREWPRKMILTR